MINESGLLIATAASVGFIHTLTGPDHYLPFIVLSRARGWSTAKTLSVTVACGAGHVGSSLIIGIAGLYLGQALNTLTGIETLRGEIAAWCLITFGFLYLIWGIKKSPKMDGMKHARDRVHDRTGNSYTQDLPGSEHLHRVKSYKELSPWILFTVFVLGPCEPFIPILLYPAVAEHISAVVMVTLAFSLTTMATMAAMVLLSIQGLKTIPCRLADRHLHAIAGGTILLCGIGIKFLGI